MMTIFSNPAAHGVETIIASSREVNHADKRDFSTLSLTFSPGQTFTIFMSAERGKMAAELAEAINSIVAKHIMTESV